MRAARSFLQMTQRCPFPVFGPFAGRAGHRRQLAGKSIWRRWASSYLVGTLSICALVGCSNTVPASKYNAVSQDLLNTQEKNKKIEAELNEARILIKSMKGQVGELRETHGGSVEDLI